LPVWGVQEATPTAPVPLLLQVTPAPAPLGGTGVQEATLVVAVMMVWQKVAV